MTAERGDRGRRRREKMTKGRGEGTTTVTPTLSLSFFICKKWVMAVATLFREGVLYWCLAHRDHFLTGTGIMIPTLGSKCALSPVHANALLLSTLAQLPRPLPELWQQWPGQGEGEIAHTLQEGGSREATPAPLLVCQSCGRRGRRGRRVPTVLLLQMQCFPWAPAPPTLFPFILL